MPPHLQYLAPARPNGVSLATVLLESRLNLTIGGLDLSVLPAFFLLSFATNAVASLGAEVSCVLMGHGPRGAVNSVST